MINRSSFLLIFALTFLLLASEIEAQSSQAMYYLNYPRSVSSLGMGEQSVALRSSDDALTYNPANLVFVERPTILFFHQPFQMASFLFGHSFPLNSYSALFKIKDIGSFGIEYIDWDWGKQKYFIFDGSRIVEKSSHIYERSFSIGYARELCKNFSTGIQLRYAKSSLGGFVTAEEMSASTEKLFVSAGLNYSPQFLESKLNIGFSLTNFGTKVWYVDEAQADPPPSELNFGIGFVPVDNNFYSLQTQLAISKPFDQGPIQNGRFPKAESSFKTLFTDWDDFPNDATLHTGIAFTWKPLNLGYGFSFLQEFYLGNYSVGSKSGLNNFYTHGGKIGVEFDGLQFSAGYAGRWHNVHYSNYLPWGFPYETVQFTFGMNKDLFFGKERQKVDYAQPKNIILSFGVGRSFRVGKFKEMSYLGSTITEGFEDGNIFFIEGAFYINDNNAIVSNIFYNPSNYIVKYLGQEFFKTKVEQFAISSSYRYHPLDIFLPIFIQGGLSIVRLNPTSPNVTPKYDYKSALLFSIGGNAEVYERIILTPFVNYNIMLNRAGSAAPRLGGYNQFDLGIKAGCKF